MRPGIELAISWQYNENRCVSHATKEVGDGEVDSDRKTKNIKYCAKIKTLRNELNNSNLLTDLF